MLCLCSLGCSHALQAHHLLLGRAWVQQESATSTHAMQACDSKAVMDSIKSNPESFLFFFPPSTTLLGNVHKPENSAFYVLLMQVATTVKAYAQVAVDNTPNTCDL